MEVTDLSPLLDQLEDNTANLEDSLQPLLKAALSDNAAKLPLLDKAKLYILITYAIESILFSFLRLNGVNAKEHPIFRELSRVKQYFDKVKHVESSGDHKSNLSLDKQAAGRFIKHALAGNSKIDRENAEHTVKDTVKQHIWFEAGFKKRNADEAGVPSGKEDIYTSNEAALEPPQ